MRANTSCLTYGPNTFDMTVAWQIRTALKHTSAATFAESRQSHSVPCSMYHTSLNRIHTAFTHTHTHTRTHAKTHYA